MDFVLGFVFLLCLLLLVMIFGEQLSVLGVFHGRWLSAVSELIADLWDYLCEAVDRCWCFVLEHLWWVLAVGSGGSGVVLVAWMMFGGIADQAAADLSERSGRLHAGGILDHVPEIVIPADRQRDITLSSAEEAGPWIDQVPAPASSRWTPEWDESVATPTGRGRIAVDEFPPPYRGGLPGSVDDVAAPRFRDWEASSVNRDTLPFESETGLRIRRQAPRYSRWTEEVSEDDDSVIRISGTTLAPRTLKDEIAAALDRLARRRRDEWRRSGRFLSSRLEDFDTRADEPSIREASDDEIELIESSVRIVPGSTVGDSDLYIDKRILTTSQRQEFEVEISITNQSPRRMSGLLVHEFLESSLRPVFIDDGGAYRDSVVTWVIDDLRPLKTQTVRLRVKSDSAGRVPTRTVISGVAAVASETVVESGRRTDFTPGRSNVQLTVGHVPRTVGISEKIEIPFRVRNIGTAVASEVVLRVDLPVGLDHFHLERDDVDRTLDVTIRDLQPDTSRVRTLRLTAEEPGEQSIIVELLEDRVQKTLTTVNIRVADQDDAEVDRPDGRLPD